jgi:uncharacterized protein
MSAKRVAWRDVAIFTMLSYLLAWAVWAAVWPVAVHSLVVGRTPATFDASSFIIVGMFAPAGAAVVMRLGVSREGLRGSLGPIGRWRYWGLAFLGPMALVLATLAVSVVFGLAEFRLGSDMPAWQVLLLLLVVGTPLSAVLAFGEEYGWRGYLLPKLLPLGEVKAAIIVGLIWGPWHLPLLLVGLNFPGKNPWAVLGVMTASTIALSLLFTRLFVAAGGSVVVLALMHGSLNSFSDRLSDSAHLIGEPFVVSVGGLVGTALTLLVVLIAHALLHIRRRAVPVTEVARTPHGSRATPA